MITVSTFQHIGMKKRRIRVVKGESFSLKVGRRSTLLPNFRARRILLPAGILLLMIGEMCTEYPEKCKLWLKAEAPTPAIKLSIECNNMDLTNLSDLKYLATFLGKVPKPCLCLSLSLINFKYPEGVLQDSWFCNHDILNLNIQSLRIEGGLSDIAEDGLRCLPVLDTLTLTGTKVHHLWRKPFYNVPNLRTLELHSNNFLATAEPDCLSALTRLTTLHVTNMDVDMQNFLRNLTSDSLKLETVDWSNSNLRSIPPEILSRLPKLQLMNLQSSRLRSIEDGFNELLDLTVLILYNNDIRVIPESNRKLIERLTALFLRKNPLLCNCDMVWLQRYINGKRNGTYGDFKEVLCAEPEELRNVPFLKAKMCEPPSESPRPPPGYNMIEIMCQSAKDNKARRFKVAGYGKANEIGEVVRIEGEKQNFTVIHNEATNQISINISNSKGKSKTLLYWPETPSRRPTYKCVTDVTEDFTAPVQYDTNYIICVFDRSEKVSLSDCKPFRTESCYSDRVWLTNSMKAQFSIIATFLLLMMLLTGGALTYFLLRYNPSLLRGSKRVITVKSYKKSPIMVMPKGYNPDAQTQRQPAHTESGNDETSSVASYISALPPRPSELLEYRLEALRKYAMPYPLPRPS